VEGGETRWLDLSQYGDDTYLARVDWSGPDALLVQVLSRDQKSLKLVRVDVKTGESSLFLEENSDTWINLHDDLRLLKTGEFVWASERSGFKHLELRCQKGQLVRTLTSGDWPVDSVVGVDDDRREVWFLAGKENPLGSALYRLSLEGGEPERITLEPGMHQVTLAPGCDRFVDVWSDLDHPPKTVLRDRSGSILQTLDDASSDPAVREYALKSPRLTEFHNRDGITLHGAFYEPRGLPPSTRAPLVVLVYGGPHVQRVTNSWDLTADLTAQFLAGRGFAVWKCDNRGSSRRGMAFEAALNRHMGEVEVRDQVDGVKFVAASFPEVDTAHVGISGGSYGGYMTLRCLMLAPEVFDSGVAIAPVTDWDGYDTGYTERYMGTPENNPEGYKAAAVLPNADRLEGDLLIIHGLIDENVHFRHSARLVKALIAADKPFELFTIPDERHSSRGLDSRRYVAEKLARFFEKTLKPASN
jgi:dipeptidyl-peptidase-4